MGFDFSTYIEKATSMDVLEVLNKVNDLLVRGADKVKIPHVAMFLIAAVLAVVIGVMGYRLMRPAVAILLGVFGLAVGVELIQAIPKLPAWVPDWTPWVLGVLAALAFFFMGYFRPQSSLAAVSALAGYFMVSFYTDNVVLAWGGAILLALITAHLVRSSVIWITGIASGFFTVSFLSRVFPKIEQLQIGYDNWIGFVIIGVVVIFYVFVQYVMNRHRSERI